MESIKVFKERYFGQGELDAFFGLFGDVFSKIAAIVALLYFEAGFPIEIVMGKIIPGVGLASIMGSIVCFYEAYELNKKEKRFDVTAEPFGIGAGQVFAWILLILIPIYKATGDANLAWQVGIAGCFIGGIIEVIGAFIAKYIKKWLPVSALMGNMAASALIWLSFNGFVVAFQLPKISVIPLFLVFITFKFNKRIIKKVPNNLLILIIGVLIAWGTGFKSVQDVKNSLQYFRFYPPSLSIKDIFIGIKEIKPYLSIIVPLQISNFLTTLQAVESAAMVGDRYPVKRCMIFDGLSTILGSLFGNPFPTTMYLGHPGWKKIGARSAYALMMALTYITCFLGLPLFLLSIVPYEVIIVLLIFVGITVSIEVVDYLDKEMSGVIFLSLFPFIAQYIHNNLDSVFRSLNMDIVEIANKSGTMLSGILNLSYGAFTSSLLYSAFIAYIYKSNLIGAGFTSLVLAILSSIGFIHCPDIVLFSPNGTQFALIYLIIAAICFVLNYIGKSSYYKTNKIKGGI